MWAFTKNAGNKPAVVSVPYTGQIAEGLYPHHKIWSKIGFSQGVGTTERDIAPWLTVTGCRRQRMHVDMAIRDNRTIIRTG